MQIQYNHPGSENHKGGLCQDVHANEGAVEQKRKIVFVLGGPGSGKGTQVCANPKLQ